MKTFVRSATHARKLCGSLLVGSLLLSPQTTAQSGGELVENGALRFNVPVHQEPGLDGQTEIWASRDDYKVSFHDGITFYPVLGKAYERNLPVTWRTTSVRANGRELLVDGATPRSESSAWRFEVHHGAIVEAYDIREDGLEQTFVLDAPVGGDLEIRGSLQSDLIGDVLRSPAHDDVVFRDAAGKPIVSYGAVTVLDAAGDSAPMHTSFDGNVITLHVDGDWLRDAVYPVVVDPLMTSQVVLSTTDTSSNPGIARAKGNARMLITDSRAVSANDYDTMGVSVLGANGSPSLIFSVISSTTSTPQTRAALVCKTNQWCIAMEIHVTRFLVTTKQIGWHLRFVSDTAFRTVTNKLITGTGDTDPVVSGDYAYRYPGGLEYGGNNALIVFQRGSGATSQIKAALIDTQNDAVILTRQLSDPTAVRCEFPDVNEQCHNKLDPWAVVWQEEGPGGRRQLRYMMVYNDGDLTNRYAIGHQTDLTKHNFKPKIDGMNGDFAVAYIGHGVGGTVSSDPTGAEVWVDSFRPGTIVGPNVYITHHPLVRLRNSYSYSTSDIAFDLETKSHWGVATEWRFLAGTYLFDRVGFEGGLLESLSVGTGAQGMAVTYLPAVHTYGIATSESTALRLREATYPTMPAPTVIGQSCGFGALGSDTTHGGSPYSGKERFKLQFTGIAQQCSGIWLLGAQALNVPILGCRLYVNPLISVPFASSSSTQVELPFNIPSGIEGPMVAQVAYAVTTTGQFGMTNGYQFQIVK